MKLKTKLTLILSTFALFFLLLSAYLTTAIAKKIIIRDAYAHLEVIASFTKKSIQDKIYTDNTELKLILSRITLQSILAHYLQYNDDASKNEIHESFSNLMAYLPDFESISVLNKNGIVILSSDKNSLGNDLSNKEYFIKGLTQNSVKFLELDDKGDLKIFSSGPIFYKDNFLGVLTVRKHSDYFLSLTTNNFELGKTG